MKRYLQCISYGLSLLALVTACDKSNDTVATTNPPPPPPPPQQPIDSVTRCDNSSRKVVSAQLIPIGKLSQARAGITVVAVGDKILFAGGRLKSDVASSKVDIYNMAANTWSSAELSQARSGIAAVAAGDKVFFAGGYASRAGTNEAYATVDIYDVQSNAWSIASLSQPRSYIAAGASGTKVLFAGGEDAQRNATYTVDALELSSGDWSIDQLSEGWANIKAITLDDRIYFGGGYRVLPNGADYERSNLIHIYDPFTNSWTIDRLKNPLGAITGVAVDNRIYWAAECFVEIKSIQAGTSTSTSLFSSAYWQSDEGQNAVVKNNKIIFFRHNSGKEAWFDIYDVPSNTWSIGELTIKVSSGAIISVNNTIYLAGGVVNGVLTDQVWRLEF